FRLRPGPRTELFATYGESDDQENLDLTFRYDVTTRTRLFASYAETLDTSQGRLSQTLSFIGTDPVTGEIIDTRTGLPFDPNANPQTIRNETTRTKTLSIGVSGSRNRNTFGLVATFVNEAIEPAMDGDDSITVDANWGRQLNRRLQMNLSGNYQNIAFGDQPREDDEYTVTGGLTYTIFSGTSAGVNAGLKYSFRKRDSQQEINEFTENSIVVTLSAVF
ncbi:MAG: outer membrane beta-barrel protein, partial [Alphaproteobacteria bacterium]